jgi:Txe/YoeB family toxin of Txe-Axe toxin-antitoxin module
VTRMIELKHTAGRLAGHAQVIQRKNETFRDLSAMQEAEKKLAAKLVEPMSDKRAARVAAIVGDWIRQSLEEEAEMAADEEEIEGVVAPEDPVAPSDKPAWQISVEESEDRENLEIREVLAVIGDASDRLCDDAYVAAVLTGTCRPKRNDIKRIRAVIGNVLPWLQSQARVRKEEIEKLVGQVEDEERKLAANPESLMLLHIYQRRIDTDIRRLRHDCAT